MKKLALFFAAFMIGLTITAQDATVDDNGITWGMVTSAVKKSDEGLTNEKKNIKSDYWKDRGKYYARYYEYDLKSIFFGMQQAYIIASKNNQPPLTQKVEGKFEIWSYDRIDFYLKDGKLQKYVRTGDYTLENPLFTAVEAYKKAVELSVKDKEKQEIGAKLKSIAEYLQSDALMAYYNEDYDASLKAFDNIIGIYELPYVSVPDSILNSFYTDCGTVARTGKKYSHAINYYKKAAARGIGGAAIYGELYICYNADGDSTQAAEMLKEGIEKNPDDKAVVELTNELINYFLQRGKDDEAKAYLLKAMEQKPDAIVYPFSLGYLYAKNLDLENADKMYKRALELDPNYVDAYLNYGVMYVEYGNKILRDANDIKDVKKYNVEKEKAFTQFKIAIPYIEKYIELSTDVSSKINALTDLQKIYYKLEMYDKSNEAKAKKEALK